MPNDTPAELLTQRAAHLARGATVHVVEDDPGVRVAFELVLREAGMNVVSHGSAEDFLDALARVTEPIACVVTDLRMGGLDGTGLLRRMRATGFDQPVIVVTGRGDAQTAVRAMKDGAADFIEKPCTSERLLHAIAMAFGPQKAKPSEADHKVRDAARAYIAKLTAREHQVLDLLAAGHPNKEVARMLGLSPRTVEIHRARMMARLGVDSFAAAVRIVVQAEMPFADHASALTQNGEAPRLRAV
ncbi:response regulator transcription factor [Roseomonas fluvialis]|uniref:DNA-binding response regulator n=1 Tax=Roseomonas fluvialis TaxID=1750527 RepID=A0ABN6P7T5_9PROT|nr:response regulator [Roseomonas fluvialis]BDG73490.1 DNA-binding response regulator [Roseomonas fluvialis]